MPVKGYGQIAFRLVVGGVLVYAAILKIIHPQQFYLSVLAYNLVGKELSKVIALWLPWVELLAGAGIIGMIWYKANLRLAQLMYAGFTIVLIVTLFRGMTTNCGCFGSAGGSVSWLHVLGDVVLYFLTTLLVIWEQIVEKFEAAEEASGNSDQQGKE